MAEKGFGVKEVNLIGASGTPTITSPNNLNLNAVNVAISTNVSIGGTLTVTGNVSVGGTLTYEDVTNIDSVGIVTARSDVIVGRGLTVTGISTFNNDVHFGLHGSGNPKIPFDESGDLLWFKKATVGGSSSKIGLGDGSSYDHLQLQQTYTGGGQSEITAFNSNILIATNSSEKNITLQSTNDITLANSVYPFIKCEENSSSDQSVTLYYGQTGSTPYANPKLQTTSTGVSVTGTVAATSFSGSGASLTGIAVTEAPVVDFTITGDGSNYYFHGGGVDETAGDPDLYLIRGQKYRFNNTTGSGHPFRFTSTGNANAAYSNGVTGDEDGVQFWTIPYDAPAKLFYVCTIHSGMVGNIYIRGANGQNDNVGVTTFSGAVRQTGNPVFIAYRTSTYSLTTSDTEMVYTNERIDVGGNYDSSNGRFTAPVDGLYEFAYATIAHNTNTVYRFQLKVNGALPYNPMKLELRLHNVSSQYGTNGEYVCYVNMTAGQYASVFARADTNVSCYGDSNFGYTYFRGRLVG